ncbi:MAG: hypothetical protein M0Z41_16415 [Peptococcaceae bacterium]|nr:hypothetical protein [Peptococcaceae bacterium]
MKTSTQLKALVRNLSKAKNVEAHRMADTAGVIRTIASSNIMIDLWQRYRKKYSYAADVAWEMAIGALRRLTEKEER